MLPCATKVYFIYSNTIAVGLVCVVLGTRAFPCDLCHDVVIFAAEAGPLAGSFENEGYFKRLFLVK